MTGRQQSPSNNGLAYRSAPTETKLSISPNKRFMIYTNTSHQNKLIPSFLYSSKSIPGQNLNAGESDEYFLHTNNSPFSGEETSKGPRSTSLNNMCTTILLL